MRFKLLKKVMRIIRKNIKKFDGGLFFTRNVVGDSMRTILIDKDVQIDVCDFWCYFEVFGLNEEEEKY